MPAPLAHRTHSLLAPPPAGLFHYRYTDAFCRTTGVEQSGAFAGSAVLYSPPFPLMCLMPSNVAAYQRVAYSAARHVKYQTGVACSTIACNARALNHSSSANARRSNNKCYQQHLATAQHHFLSSYRRITGMSPRKMTRSRRAIDLLARHLA